MPVIVVTRFQADPADAEQVRARHAALVATTRAAVPGLTEARLGRTEDGTWVGVWRWDSPDSLRAAREVAPGTVEAKEAFALTREPTAEEIEILDEH